jgi:hypothetical protein
MIARKTSVYASFCTMCPNRSNKMALERLDVAKFHQTSHADTRHSTYPKSYESNLYLRFLNMAVFLKIRMRKQELDVVIRAAHMSVLNM